MMDLCGKKQAKGRERATNEFYYRSAFPPGKESIPLYGRCPILGWEERHHGFGKISLRKLPNRSLVQVFRS